MARQAWALAVLLAACGGGSGESELFQAAEARDSGADVVQADDDSGPVDDASPGERVCAPGKTDACACPSGSTGAQRCKDDGAGWGDCFCKDEEGETEVPGWEWWCNVDKGACMCDYAPDGTANRAGCPLEYGCCIRYDVGGKPNQCECWDGSESSCRELAGLRGGTVVSRCPP